MSTDCIYSLFDAWLQDVKTAMKVLEKGRIHIAAICVGVAERMLRDALNYAIERKQFGQPIAKFQLVQAKR